RASDSGSEGLGFESQRDHWKKGESCVGSPFCLYEQKDLVEKKFYSGRLCSLNIKKNSITFVHSMPYNKITFEQLL
ncbi:hypothetical protein, partial [Prevotella sp.]|uniref:hypothetical protein n=1 Tax=Prevotella sp. TaxID=59823 RepID=UPI00307BD758